LAGIGVSQWESVSEYSEDGDVAVATATACRDGWICGHAGVHGARGRGASSLAL